ncbi:TAXI family TRAP transporter solute-binding subunit [Halomonas daqingensis]|uniref:TAXI family TRAP transporter solute-binding subunit n=1 Tax=Billgrantia sulfidoxydans TaxID=2733484 RepID=A0ABX7W8K6_9GAMM|nr:MULTISPECIES: TAXI family TRAP transporter solute-binding subunit [Halomonas]MCE8014366.1 TAXI family TRAP transporter solute-binding subunit [Halomonas desiderata]MCE8031125.1 TAXI family TRAP transporter solute-binding subunit [Halomonas desiderata]OUE45509.1 ABC transporter substrate-binding protein [Halomonas desiderata SP1]QTP55867.1 TAXI family TRAP transporter solute-binding subunit [Halomonas sulfidoxydans]
MKISIKKTVVAMALVVPGLVMNIASAQSYNLTVSGASPGGLWSLLGAGLDSALKENHPGSTITYQTSGGGIANVAILQRDDANLAIIEDSVLQLARDGEAPFREPVNDDVRVLAYLYTWSPMQAVIRESVAERHGIKSFEDIADVEAPLTIAINRRGNIASNVAIAMLETIGAGPDEIKSWGGDIIYAASGEQTSLIQDRRIDMFLNSLFVGQASIMQAASSVDLNLLPLSEETISTVADRSGTNPFIIPGGAYEWAPNDTPTVTVSAALAVRSDMDEEMAYNLTKAFYENYEKIAGVHSAMRALTPEIMASVEVVPYHDGAERYLKEVGLR